MPWLDTRGSREESAVAFPGEGGVGVVCQAHGAVWRTVMEEVRNVKAKVTLTGSPLSFFARSSRRIPEPTRERAAEAAKQHPLKAPHSQHQAATATREVGPQASLTCSGVSRNVASAPCCELDRLSVSATVCTSGVVSTPARARTRSAGARRTQRALRTASGGARAPSGVGELCGRCATCLACIPAAPSLTLRASHTPCRRRRRSVNHPGVKPGDPETVRIAGMMGTEQQSVVLHAYSQLRRESASHQLSSPAHISPPQAVMAGYGKWQACTTSRCQEGT